MGKFSPGTQRGAKVKPGMPTSQKSLGRGCGMICTPLPCIFLYKLVTNVRTVPWPGLTRVSKTITAQDWISAGFASTVFPATFHLPSLICYVACRSTVSYDLATIEKGLPSGSCKLSGEVRSLAPWFWQVMYRLSFRCSAGSQSSHNQIIAPNMTNQSHVWIREVSQIPGQRRPP